MEAGGETSGSQQRQQRERDPRSALYVQIPKSEAEKLDRAAFELKAHKRDLVAALVARYVDPSTSEGLDRLRALGAHGPTRARANVPQPPAPRPAEPTGLTIRVSRASDWVVGMQRSIREFAQSRKCPNPLVRVMLDDGEKSFVQAMTPGPDDDFVTFTVYEPGDEATCIVVLRLDAIRKVELLRTAPSAQEKDFVFHPRGVGIGFTTES